MADTLQLDKLDRDILNALLSNARTPYAELAKQFNVSAGTIHVRVEKMRQGGIILGTRIDVDPKKLGFDVCCFIGIILKRPRLSCCPEQTRSSRGSGRSLVYHRSLQCIHQSDVPFYRCPATGTDQ